tara:strand:+ start:788 stop:1069 length:282 start_codon:yes stop_codon:yes gene_type:complete
LDGPGNSIGEWMIGYLFIPSCLDPGGSANTRRRNTTGTPAVLSRAKERDVAIRPLAYSVEPTKTPLVAIGVLSHRMDRWKTSISKVCRKQRRN